MSRLVALDTETTGLDPDTEDVFEIAVVDLSDTPDLEQVWRIRPTDEAVAAMHPKALEANRYHERTADPQWVWHPSPGAALAELHTILHGAHIVGAVPDFDTRHLTSLYRRHGIEPPRWHYHLIDVETLAAGWLWGVAMLKAHQQDCSPWDLIPSELVDLPWRSDDLSRACGVDPPSEDERHTALGDARWVARWYAKLTELDPAAAVPA